MAAYWLALSVGRSLGVRTQVPVWTWETLPVSASQDQTQEPCRLLPPPYLMVQDRSVASLLTTQNWPDPRYSSQVPA